MPSQPSSWRKPRVLIAAFALAVVVTLAFHVAIYQDMGYVQLGNARELIVRDLFPSPNPLHWTWLGFLVVTLVVLFVGGYFIDRAKVANRRPVAALVLVATVASLFYMVTGVWNSDTDESNALASANVLIVEKDGVIPNALNPVTKGAKQTKPGARCLYSSVHNTPSCIQATGLGPFLTDWVTTPDRATAVRTLTRFSTKAVKRGTAMSETLSYNFEQRRWTMLLNGTANTPISGVVSWDTHATMPEMCAFTGDHELNYAFGGRWGTNLDDEIVRKFPRLRYNLGDASAFCRGADQVSEQTPVIVLPVTETVSQARIATTRAAGVLMITGSPSGEPVIKHLCKVEPGSLPVSAYPESLALNQRDTINWAAGRGNMNDGFGFNPVHDRPDLVQDRTTDRLYWVTLLQNRTGPREGRVSAYAIIAADETWMGMLAEQRVYVLPDRGM